ncbi:proline racemase family protein [Ochrobactrum chromiisoli]|uniref:Proline racemase family protein n=1 Tax=Ochrobactrum chromiisoli TaxID=2993941 RepID=A0ABT3QSH2_9HYPH|nr:proline racemase family protein [Ochrobactrum chromiisoli]MCX2698557.1 proline racemase family protein [Ochrobactrum chromiisoli]
MRWNRTFTVVGCHAEGEVGNVVVGGIVDVPGETMFEKKEYLEENMDEIRGLLLFEPRGAPYVNANIILPACDKTADLGYVIVESTEYPPMSGSNTMCVATVALETGIVRMQEPETRLRMEAPAGIIETKCTCKDGKVTRVEFTNVPAFALHLDTPVEVEGLGTVLVDTSYGGMTFAHVNAKALGFEIRPDEARDMSLLGKRIKAAVNEQLEVVHPENEKIRNVSNVIFEGPVERRDGIYVSKNGTVCLHGRLDRSPTGTGTTSRLAVMSAKGQIKQDELFRNHSITGTHFDSRIVASSKVGSYPGVIVTIAGQAWITSVGQYGVDPTDPYPRGHQVSDVWL